MAMISDILNKQLNCIQKEKINEMQSSIDKPEAKLQEVSLAEIRGQTMERLEFEKSILFKQTNVEFREKIKQILGLDQMLTNEDEILSEIRDYKNSTTFWRKKFHNFCSDIESMAERLEISEFGHKCDAKEDEKIITKVKDLMKRIDSIKCENIRLRQQIQQKDNYCQTLIDLRNKLNLEIDCLREEKFQISTERDSLKDKCFWQNSIINVLDHKREDTLRSIDGLNNGLKQTETNDSNLVHIFETPNQSKTRKSLVLSSLRSSRDKYWLRSATKDTLPLHQLSTCVSPKQKRTKREFKQKSDKKLFD